MTKKYLQKKSAQTSRFADQILIHRYNDFFVVNKNDPLCINKSGPMYSISAI